jgi:cell wall-associated NlpC family hydrolase
LSTAATVPAATASTVPALGAILSAVENTFTHKLTVSGWAYDPSASGQSIVVRLVVDGTYAASTTADAPSPVLDADRHISGNHHFTLTVGWSRTAKNVVIKSHGASASAPIEPIASHAVTLYYPPPGARIIDVAKRYVGYPYVEGGASPAGFDCSGYTMYVYDQARVKSLPHNAEEQLLATRRIGLSSARPGDLVFYMSGGTAYHVAIYAGHGWQYAAATPADGVRYQKVWSTAVRYGTDWH